MRTLIKDVVIPAISNRKQNVIIEDGVLKNFSSEDSYDREIEGEDLVLIPSFTDIGTFNGEPGHEERETLDTLTRAAKSGGFGELILLPLTHPVADNASYIKNIVRSSGLNGIALSPLGCITADAEGNEIAELLDMIEEGAVGFTDGYDSIQSSGVMIRALDYVKRFGSIVLNMPYDNSVAPDGVVHEGKRSTRMGMRGIPSIAETLMLQRDIDLLEYTASRLHVWNVSTAESVEIIRSAKEDGMNISASVSYLHLLETDEAIKGYDEVYKIHPPLRSERDKKALIEGVKSGVIDCITSMHRPWNEEKKMLEFAQSATGAAGLETMLSALWTYAPELRDWQLLNKCLNIRPRKIFGLEPIKMSFDKKSKFTLVDRGSKYTFDESQISSRSKNYPYIGEEFDIKIIPFDH